MKLYLLRHAIAVARGTPGFEVDSKRPLTPKGRRELFRIGEGMKALGLSFDLILSSPYLRASQTAEVIAGVFDLNEKVELCDALSADAEPTALIEEINTNFGDRQSVLSVGLEPYLSTLISTLVAGRGDLSLPMKKGGLCKLTADRLRYGHCAKLDWLLAPKHLTRIR